MAMFSTARQRHLDEALAARARLLPTVLFAALAAFVVLGRIAVEAGLR